MLRETVVSTCDSGPVDCLLFVPISRLYTTKHSLGADYFPVGQRHAFRCFSLAEMPLL
jgi:hypothetical protein